jgi:hypothetical protein
VQASVKITGIKETMSELKKLDPELLKQMRRDIKTEPGLVNAMSAIKSKAPAISPLRGMIHNGRTAYARPRVATSFKPSVRLDRAKERSIITINTTAPKNAIGFQIIDMVGRGSKRNTGKARGMQKGVGGRPSRYVWAAVEGKEQSLSNAVFSIITKYSNMANVRLRVK